MEKVGRGHERTNLEWNMVRGNAGEGEMMIGVMGKRWNKGGEQKI